MSEKEHEKEYKEEEKCIWVTDTARMDLYMAAFVAADIANGNDLVGSDPVFWLEHFADRAVESIRAVDDNVRVQKKIVAEDRIDDIRTSRGLGTMWPYHERKYE